MKVGFLEGDLSIGFGEGGQLHSTAILSTSYNVLPIWLRIAHDNVSLAKTACEAISNQWDDDPEIQRKLLIAELTPAVQTFVACGVVFDALYEQIRPFSKISEKDVDAWKKKKTSRAKQISEIIRRVYKLNGEDWLETKNVITEVIRFRDKAVHPSHEIQRSMNRPDVPVGLDWRFCAYRYENASTCYTNTMQVLTYLRKKSSSQEKVNENMDTIFEALEELGLLTN